MTEQKRNKVSIIAAILLILACLAPLLLAGQAGNAVLDKIANPQDVALAKELLAQVAARDFDAIEKRGEPEIMVPELRTALGRMADGFPNEQTKDIKLLGYHFLKSIGSGGATETVSVTLEYQFSKAWLIAEVTLRKKDGGEHRVAGLNVRPQPDSVENMTRFSLSGKSGLHYAVLILAIAEMLFCAWILMLCIRTPIPKRKWLWVIFVMAGFLEFRFNWMTGTLFLNPLMIRIPPAQFSQGLNEPFFILLMFPIGALVFLTQRKKWLAGAKENLS